MCSCLCKSGLWVRHMVVDVWSGARIATISHLQKLGQFVFERKNKCRGQARKMRAAERWCGTGVKAQGATD